MHGAKKEFALSIGYDNGQIVSMWESGASKSYMKKIHEIAAVYNVDPDWLLGKTDKKEKPTIVSDDGLSDSQRLLISQLRSMSLEEFEKKEAAIRAILDL
jgi:transcriptional regulator with XRE-family HTH domain